MTKKKPVVVKADRETVGKLSSELLKQESPTNSPVELEREMHTDYDKNIYECVEAGKKIYPHDFYVIVLTKRERLMPNVLRNYFFHRKSCPTPEWDQAVYRVIRTADHIAFMWVIPSRDTCEYMLNNVNHVRPEEKELLQFVIDFTNGTLFKVAKRLNNEKEESSLLVKP